MWQKKVAAAIPEDLYCCYEASWLGGYITRPIKATQEMCNAFAEGFKGKISTALNNWQNASGRAMDNGIGGQLETFDWSIFAFRHITNEELDIAIARGDDFVNNLKISELPCVGDWK